MRQTSEVFAFCFDQRVQHRKTRFQFQRLRPFAQSGALLGKRLV
jgi:hypothetical protein